MGRYRPEAYLVVMAVDDKATLDQAERTLAYLRCAAYHLTRHVSEVWQCSEDATMAFINVSMKTQIMTKREDAVVVWVLLSLNIYLPLILFQTEGSHSGSFRTSSNIADMSAAVASLKAASLRSCAGCRACWRARPWSWWQTRPTSWRAAWSSRQTASRSQSTTTSSTSRPRQVGRTLGTMLFLAKWTIYILLGTAHYLVNIRKYFRVTCLLSICTVQ